LPSKDVDIGNIANSKSSQIELLLKNKDSLYWLYTLRSFRASLLSVQQQATNSVWLVRLPKLNVKVLHLVKAT
jgi:hypothetical protein